jgi:hypothetical protein
MKAERNEELLENLAAAATIAFLGLLIGAASLAASGRGMSEERAAVQALAGKAQVVAAIKVADPAYRHVFRVESRGSLRFGAVVDLGRPGRESRVALILDKTGVLEAWKPLDASSSAVQRLEESSFRQLLGKGAEGRIAVPAGRRYAPGEAESLEAAISLLTRLSGVVRGISATKD